MVFVLKSTDISMESPYTGGSQVIDMKSVYTSNSSDLIT
jgi:hypothetical protein